MTVKLTSTLSISGSLKEHFAKLAEPMQLSATQAIKVTAGKIRDGVKQTIRGSKNPEFTRRFVNGMKVSVKPKTGISINASLHAFHKFNFIGVFQSGKSITGKPLIWLPLDNIPQKIGGKRMTPRNFEASIGKLQFVKVPGHPPLLVAPIATTSTGALPKKITVGRLRGRAKKQGKPRLVPVFVGVRNVDIAKRFNTKPVIDRAANELQGEYFAALARNVR